MVSLAGGPASMTAVTEAETVVRRYYSVVADLDATADELAEVLHPDVRIVEHPNAINPRGSRRDRDVALAAYRAGKGLLSEQSIDLEEVIASADRVVVRATWRGTVAAGADALPAGAKLEAHLAAWLTVSDGMIREHETFDCYEPMSPQKPTDSNARSRSGCSS
jgi:ketosteroid isomerase-like protein